jgi:hypothetical protein
VIQSLLSLAGYAATRSQPPIVGYSPCSALSHIDVDAILCATTLPRCAPEMGATSGQANINYMYVPFCAWRQCVLKQLFARITAIAKDNYAEGVGCTGAWTRRNAQKHAMRHCTSFHCHLFCSTNAPLSNAGTFCLGYCLAHQPK